MTLRSDRGRGNALPETALIISTVMLIFFGTIKLALTGYEQAETDGASFVAAHAASLATDPPTGQTRGQDKARGIFTHVPASNIAVTQADTTVAAGPNKTGEVVGTSTRDAQSLLFGAASVALNSHVIEPVIAAPFTNTSNSLVVKSATLTNCLSADKAGTIDPYTKLPWGFNPSTPTAASCDLTSAMGSIDLSNSTTNPFHKLECRLQVMMHLVNNPGPNSQWFIDGKSPNGGVYTHDHPWPNSYRTGTGGSINDPNVRDPAHDLNIPVKSNYINLDGTAGIYVAPLYDLGKGTCV